MDDEDRKEKKRIWWRNYYATHKDVTRATKARYLATAKGKATIKKKTAKYRAEHPERVKAWRKAKSIPRKPCKVCQAKNSHRHHADPSKPLEVEFYCPLHHVEAESKVKGN